MICAVLGIALILTGCSAGGDVPQDTDVVTVAATESSETSGSSDTSDTSETIVTSATETSKPPLTPFKFNPHLYSATVAGRIPQSYWDALHNLCDAVREGKDTFECQDIDSYNWATDTAVLCCYMPPAGGIVEGKTDDGSLPFENGIGKISYKMPVEDYLKRQADFEAMIEDILNSTIESDDTDYEKALKIYLYVTDNYTYDEEVFMDDNFVYSAFRAKKGMCVNLAAVYVHLLLQAGIDAVSLSIYEETICHSWTYAVIGGKGYHIDPTWGLKADNKIWLDYFMMSDRARDEDGCLVRNLAVAVIPENWIKDTGIKVTADDEHYCLRKNCTFVSLDEDSKILHYLDSDGNPKEFYYGE